MGSTESSGSEKKRSTLAECLRLIFSFCQQQECVGGWRSQWYNEKLIGDNLIPVTGIQWQEKV
jgi:hypothetical protein